MDPNERNPNDKHYPLCHLCRTETPIPGERSTTGQKEEHALPPVIPIPQPTASNSPGEREASRAAIQASWDPPESSQQVRGRRHHRRQARTRDTPPIMAAFLARGAEQERARQASARPQSLPYRGPNPSFEDVPLTPAKSREETTAGSSATLNTPDTPNDPTTSGTSTISPAVEAPSDLTTADTDPTLHTPATTASPFLRMHSPSTQTNRALFSDPHHLNIPDQSSGPPYFHVTATYTALQGGGGFTAQSNPPQPNGQITSVFEIPLGAAREVAEEYSRFEKYENCRKGIVIKLSRDHPQGEKRVRHNGWFEGLPGSEPWGRVGIEIVESRFRMPDEERAF